MSIKRAVDFIVLEDDAVIAADLEQTLVEAGARSVAIAGSAAQFRTQFRPGSIAVVDLGNDAADRIALAAEIAADTGAVIVLSGTQDIRDRYPALAKVKALIKPFASQALFDLVNGAVDDGDMAGAPSGAGRDPCC